MAKQTMTEEELAAAIASYAENYLDDPFSMASMA
jgi:hypothetical protein